MRQIYLIIAIFLIATCPIFVHADDEERSFELVYWETINDSKDASLYELYLEKYPQGTFAELAKRLIVKYRPEEPKEDSTLIDEEVSKKDSTLLDEEVPKKDSILMDEEVRPSSKDVAIFPFNLLDDASEMQVRLTQELVRSINAHECLNLRASYYALGAYSSVPSLRGAYAYNKGIDLSSMSLWTGTSPNSKTICETGRKLGVDTVIIGSIKVTNPWSDGYMLGHIRIYYIDIHTGAVVKARDLSGNANALHVLPGVIQKATEGYIDKFCMSST
jgi:hypothetical protein